MNIDAAAGGSLMNRSQTDAFNLIEEMALNQLQWSSERGTIRAPGRYETDALTKLGAQMEAMQRKFDQMNVSAVSQFNPCAICGGTDHLPINCTLGMSSEGEIEQVNALNNNFRPQNNPYSNTYNPGWRNHPNFSWRNDQNAPNQNQTRPNQGFSPRQFEYGPQKSNLEKMMENFIEAQGKKK
jgi:hypothetical protein